MMYLVVGGLILEGKRKDMNRVLEVRGSQLELAEVSWSQRKLVEQLDFEVLKFAVRMFIFVWDIVVVGCVELLVDNEESQEGFFDFLCEK